MGKIGIDYNKELFTTLINFKANINETDFPEFLKPIIDIESNKIDVAIQKKLAEFSDDYIKEQFKHFKKGVFVTGAEALHQASYIFEEFKQYEKEYNKRGC